MAFICIAPAVAAKLFGPKGLRFTIGNDEATADATEPTPVPGDSPSAPLTDDDAAEASTSPARSIPSWSTSV